MGSVYCQASEAPPFSGMPIKPEAFLCLPVMSGLCLDLKKALCCTGPFGGVCNKNLKHVHYCHVIAHGDEEVRLILSSRIEWEYQAVKKWPLGENVGHGGHRPDVHT